MNIPDTTSSMAELFTRRRLRHMLTAIAVVFTVFTYYSVVNAVNPNQNFIKNTFRHFFPDSYEFWSGSPGGFYIELGKNLEDRSRRDSSIDILNREGNGGQWNLDRVSNGRSLMGLTQWDTLNSSINIEKKKRVRAVGPLYEERLHILYDVEAWEKHVRDNWARTHAAQLMSNGSANGLVKAFSNVVSTAFVNSKSIPKVPDPIPRLIIFGKDKTEPAAVLARSFVRESIVAIGPQQSGSHKFAQGVLITAGLTPKEPRQIGFEAGFESLTGSPKNGAEKVSVVFTIAGAPLPGVKKYLEAQRILVSESVQRIALASIDPEMVQKLIKDHQFFISGIGFDKFYPDSKDATTFSADAYLISSLDVPNTAIVKTLELIVQARADIRSQLGIGAGQPFQLDDTSFYERFKSEHDKAWFESLQEFVLFSATVLIGTVVSLTFILWMNSSLKKIRYVRQIEKITHSSLPQNANLVEGERDIPQPIIFQSQVDIIGRIIHGISGLIKTIANVQTDHADQLITDTHFEHLSQRFSDSKELLQRNLARRLHEHLKRSALSPEDLRSYHTAGYLTTEDYDRLASFLEQPKASPSSTDSSDEPLELNDRDRQVLKAIDEQSMGLARIAKLLEIPVEAVRETTQRLEAAGLIQRSRSNAPYKLTARGQKYV